MQALLDFLPVIAFVVAYWLADLQTAIAVIMAAVLIQVIATYLIKGSVNKMLMASAGLVVVLGGISLMLNNDTIFKWKPTVLNWIFAAVFFGSQYIGDKTIIQRMLQSVDTDAIRLVPGDWRRLNYMWVLYFIVAGAANIFVAYTFSEAFWVNFKLFGLFGMTLIFVVLQFAWLSRRNIETSEANSDGGR